MKKPITYNDCVAALAGERLPAAFVDIDAFDSNIESILSAIRGSGKTLRVATKSIRCVGLTRRIFQKGGDLVKGVMSYSMEEAAFLAARGFDDILVAYPSALKSDMELMVEMTKMGVNVSIVADSLAHIETLSAAGRRHGVSLKAIIEVDTSYRPIGKALHVGPRRSPVRAPEQALKLAKAARSSGGVEIAGVMGYEAHIAGLTDKNPFTQSTNVVKKALREMAKPDVIKSRGAVVKKLRDEGFALPIVNGGGTGSADSTSRDPSVTEVSAGSGFYCPHLFSYYTNLSLAPAAFFALQVVRHPTSGIATCSGGGYVASGEAGRDRLPLPYLPAGGKLLGMEGAGEVQTPVEFSGGAALPPIGAPIIFRHAKAGELCERFNELLLISGGAIVGREKTYRGEGACFM